MASPLWTISKLFDLSLTSPGNYEFVKSLCAKNLFFEKKIEVKFNLSSSPWIHLKCGNDTMKWTFYGKRDPERFKNEDIEPRSLYLPDVLNGGTMRLDYWKEEEPGHYGSQLESIEMVLHFTECLVVLLNTKPVRVVEFDRYHVEELKKMGTMKIFKGSWKSDITKYSKVDMELICFLRGSEHKFAEVSNNRYWGVDYLADHLRAVLAPVADLNRDHWRNRRWPWRNPPGVFRNDSKPLGSEDFSEILKEWEDMKTLEKFWEKSSGYSAGNKDLSIKKLWQSSRTQKPFKSGQPGKKDSQHFQRNCS